ncbi:WD40 repeat domain-containing serine/threonine protein kinase [Frigoriglobus tundricola]|uniref:WD40 repeat domain-containing serine/threonine protein kinase n=1 Tax=Frigoriglobus tundricola TaxID=2774151 RepID=UPI00148EA539|nr:serine/threonine-protein kinase [Frigoriglobus tundricola]
MGRELGRGGMGVVYLAEHTRVRRVVAVKLIRAGEAARPEDVARFRREAEAVAALAHPNVVALYDAGEQDRVPWLALEYVSGGTLREHLGGRPLPPRAAAEIARGLARGAAAVHAAGVVHRDIKPANVLLAPAAADGGPAVPKLTDFGLAKDVAGAGVTMSGAVIGTPHYMAPEQARAGATVGAAADVYGVGAVLYEVLTGSPPFNGSDPVAVLHQVATRDPVPVRQLQPTVPRDLQTICHKCLEKDPARRYPSAAALAADLDRFLDGRPILARPVGAFGSGWRLARRNPVLSALVLALVAAVATGGVGVTWKWREAAGERDKTAAAERDTAAERDAAVGARTAARRQMALALLDKGIGAAEAGRVGEGLVWMAEALAAAPADDADLDRAVRMNIAGWLPHAPRVRSMTRLPQDGVPVALTPDGRALVTRASTGVYRLNRLEPSTDASAGDELNTDYALAISSNGRFVVQATNREGDEGHTLTCWDALARRAVGSAYPTGTTTALTAPAPNGTTVAVVLADGRVVPFDLATGRAALEPLCHPHKGDRVTALAYTPDGKALFTWTDGPGGPAAHAWDTATGARSAAPVGSGVVRRAAFSPGGDRLVTVSADGTAQLWDVPAGAAVGLPLASAGAVSQLVFSRTGGTPCYSRRAVRPAGGTRTGGN